MFKAVLGRQTLMLIESRVFLAVKSVCKHSGQNANSYGTVSASKINSQQCACRFSNQFKIVYL